MTTPGESPRKRGQALAHHGQMLSLAGDFETGGEIHVERTVVVGGCVRAVGMGAGLGVLQAQGTESIQGGIEQLGSNALAAVGWGDDEAQDHPSVPAQRVGQGVSRIVQVGELGQRSGVAPADHLAVDVGQVAVQLAVLDALADRQAVLGGGALYPFLLGMRSEIEVAVAAGPIGVVAEGFAVEEGQVVIQAGGGEGADCCHRIFTTD